MKYFFSLIFVSTFLFNGCQTPTPVNTGIQSGFEGLNPAAVVAVPIFIMPDAASEFASIDYSLLSTEKIVPLLENKIVESFDNQPNINGYPFSVVKKAINFNSNIIEDKKTVLKEKKEIGVWDSLNFELKDVAKRFSSRDIKTRLLITPDCLSRKNFIQFYSYCLAGETTWLSGLNQLSARVLNSDTALITVVTNLQDHYVNDKYQIEGAVAIMLVDTNNGNLIWGNYSNKILTNPVEKKYFPKWSELVNSLLSPDFWNGFPGRIEKLDANINEKNEG